jgi:CxxC-x17-CxxC domain-containing protein
MQTEFIDRLLICVDCHGQFVFTAGEQIFFLDKQFKNDPKRCKPCKAKRAGVGIRASGTPATAVARTETRTECSECHIETTVPFKPTQGRPVLCRQCFQGKRPATAIVAANPVSFDLSAAMNETISTGMMQSQA